MAGIERQRRRDKSALENLGYIFGQVYSGPRPATGH